MAGYLRELMSDYVLCDVEDMGNAVGTDWHLTRILILEGLKSLLQASEITLSDIQYLNHFFVVPGETFFGEGRPNAVEILRKTFTKLEQVTGLTDEDFIRYALESRPTLKPIEAALVRKLIEKGNEF